MDFLVPLKVCNRYSNSKKHRVSSGQESLSWLTAAKALCCSFAIFVYVPISDVLRLVKNEQTHHVCSYLHKHRERDRAYQNGFPNWKFDDLNELNVVAWNEFSASTYYVNINFYYYYQLLIIQLVSQVHRWSKFHLLTCHSNASNNHKCQPACDICGLRFHENHEWLEKMSFTGLSENIKSSCWLSDCLSLPSHKTCRSTCWKNAAVAPGICWNYTLFMPATRMAAGFDNNLFMAAQLVQQLSMDPGVSVLIPSFSNNNLN